MVHLYHIYLESRSNPSSEAEHLPQLRITANNTFSFDGTCIPEEHDVLKLSFL
jgi:hypothetical protein